MADEDKVTLKEFMAANPGANEDVVKAGLTAAGLSIHPSAKHPAAAFASAAEGNAPPQADAVQQQAPKTDATPVAKADDDAIILPQEEGVSTQVLEPKKEVVPSFKSDAKQDPVLTPKALRGENAPYEKKVIDRQDTDYDIRKKRESGYVGAAGQKVIDGIAVVGSHAPGALLWHVEVQGKEHSAEYLAWGGSSGAAQAVVIQTRYGNDPQGMRFRANLYKDPVKA